MNTKILSKFIQENILFIIIPIVVLALGVQFTIKQVGNAIGSYHKHVEKKQELRTKKARLNELERLKRKQIEVLESKKNSKAKSGKVIYEVLDQQFTPEASFGIMFENILSNISNSGLRVRSIDYNYSPQDDKVLLTNAPGYNACELSFVTVGNYSQLQTFFKNIAKENYLTNIYEVYIEPYEKDKSILVTRFKVRLYTKIVKN